MGLVIKNVRLITDLVEEYEETTADIVVEDGRIKDIMPANTVSDIEAIDADGKTLIPGMINLHMHLYFATEDFNRQAMKTLNECLIDSISYAREHLSDGFTTIRDCGNAFDIGVTVRDAVNAGVFSGPRIYTSGRCMTPTAKGNDTFPNLYNEIDTINEIKKECRKEYVRGIDFLKYMATGSVANVTGEPGAIIATKEEINAMQEMAEQLGTYVGVHCHGTKAIKYCIEAGIRTIEHASFLTQECIDLIKNNNYKTSLIPTLSPVVQIYESNPNEMPEFLRVKIPQIFKATNMLVKAEHDGIMLGWGTDTAKSFQDTHVGYEFYARHKVGFTNLEMLRQATINGAKILGVDRDYGTIAKGKVADLVLIDGNPDENYEVMLKKPYRVFKDGQVVACNGKLMG